MRNFYDDRSFNYKKFWIGREYEDEGEKIALRRLLSFVSNKENIVDIGGGFGRLACEYAPIFKHCLLIDPSERLLNQAEKFCRGFRNLIFKKGFIEKLPIENNTFGLAITIRTFHHLENTQKAIAEIYRILKPKGHLILEFANKARFKSLLRAFFNFDFVFFTDHKPININLQEKEIPFFNRHPNEIKTLLLSNNFKIIKVLPVSNFRSRFIKRIIPLKILLKLESFFSFLFSNLPILRFFGPSVFILAQKN